MAIKWFVLLLKDAVRTDYLTEQQGKSSTGKPYIHKRKVYVFLCIDCGRELLLSKCGAETHQGRCKSCAFKIVGRNSRKRPYECLYHQLCKAARESGKSCDLTYEQFVGFISIVNCHYCSKEITWTKYNTRVNGRAYNLDRKDNSIGYTKDNLVVCCTRCNMVRRDFFTYEQFCEVGKLLYKWRLEGSEKLFEHCAITASLPPQ